MLVYFDVVLLLSFNWIFSPKVTGQTNVISSITFKSKQNLSGKGLNLGPNELTGSSSHDGGKPSLTYAHPKGSSDPVQLYAVCY